MKTLLMLLALSLLTCACEKQHDKDEPQSVPGTASFLRTGGDAVLGAK